MARANSKRKKDHNRLLEWRIIQEQREDRYYQLYYALFDHDTHETVSQAPSVTPVLVSEYKYGVTTKYVDNEETVVGTVLLNPRGEGSIQLVESKGAGGELK